MRIVTRHAAWLAVAAVAVLTAGAPAHAQWMWKDEAGRLVVSDQPPPTNVPMSRILKTPKQRTATASGATATEPGAPAVEAGKSDAPKSIADRDLESKQRQKEAAEATKKSDDEAAKARAMQENCTAMRGNLAGLQAGGRAARVNEKGERFYIDDAQRAVEIQKTQGQIAQYCR